MKAMILAAGRGQRMFPLTTHTHKGLLKIGSETLIERHIRRLADAGIRDIVINVSYFAEQIQQCLNHGEKYQVSIQYSVEQQPLEVGGGIISALPLLGNEPFITVNCDVWSDFSFSILTNKSLPPAQLGHLILVPNPSHVPQGDFALENGMLAKKDVEGFTYSGIGLYNPQLFNDFNSDNTTTTTKVQPLLPILQRGIAKHALTGEKYLGQWIDVGTPERLASVNQLFGQSS